MKLIPLLCALTGTIALSSWAQVSVQVDFDQEQYFANESLLAAVRITNLSGRTLDLGASDDWLDFAVESDTGVVVRQLEKLPVRGAFELPNAGRATRRVNLAECFDMTEVGRYRVTAFVRVPDLNLELVSPASPVNIVKGTTVWEQTFGVPPNPGVPPGPLETRKYELVQAMNSKSVQLYVRVSDQTGGKVLKVFSLGRLLTFSRPEGRVDRAGKMHALFQVSAKQFHYHVVNPAGDHLIRQTFQYTSTRPRLLTDDEGQVRVVGGFRLVNDLDLPQPHSEESANPAPAEDPSAPSDALRLPPTTPSPLTDPSPVSPAAPAPRDFTPSSPSASAPVAPEPRPRR